LALIPAIVRYAAGTLVYEEGARGDFACLVRSGEIEIFQMRGEEKIEIARTKAGQMFGELELVDGAARMANARAATNAEIEMIPRAAFLNELLALDPAIHNTLLELIGFVRTAEPLALGAESDGSRAEMAAFLRGVAFGRSLDDVKSPFTRTIADLVLYYAGRRVPH
jgi:diguanylate cyclase